MQQFDYLPIMEALRDLNGYDKNKLDYLTQAHSILSEGYVLLCEYIGRLEARKMICQTVKGRTEYGFSKEDVEELFAELSKAEAYKFTIEKAVFMVQQKFKSMNEFSYGV